MFGNNGADDKVGNAGNDNLDSIDRVVNNEDLDGGTGIDVCLSDPDHEVRCEIEGDPIWLHY